MAATEAERNRVAEALDAVQAQLDDAGGQSCVAAVAPAASLAQTLRMT
ncbi:hypothetical protein [Variovorax sp. Root411]|nr:hypothetical protein [Variovorax sp. Root411]